MESVVHDEQAIGVEVDGPRLIADVEAKRAVQAPRGPSGAPPPGTTAPGLRDARAELDQTAADLGQGETAAPWPSSQRQRARRPPG